MLALPVERRLIKDRFIRICGLSMCKEINTGILYGNKFVQRTRVKINGMT